MTAQYWILVAFIIVVALIVIGDVIADSNHQSTNQPPPVTGIRG